MKKYRWIWALAVIAVLALIVLIAKKAPPAWKSWNGTYLIDFFGECVYPTGEKTPISGEKIIEVRGDKIVLVRSFRGDGLPISSTSIDSSGKATATLRLRSKRTGDIEEEQEISVFAFTKASDGDYYFVAEDTKDNIAAGSDTRSCRGAGKGEQINKTNSPLTGYETIL